MTQTAVSSDLQFHIERELEIAAPIDIVFESILEQMGPLMTGEHDAPMEMKLEPFPGGRWYRDLGEGNGHLWGHVQSIKVPTLLEITGPLFMSAAVTNNVIYRLSEERGGTRLAFAHTAFGLIPEREYKGMPDGWDDHLDRISKSAQARA